MPGSKWPHGFEWLINALLVAVPLGLMIIGWWVPSAINSVGLFGTMLLFPISLGCFLFYSWNWYRQQPHHLRVDQWGLVVFYALAVMISLSILIKTL